MLCDKCKKREIELNRKKCTICLKREAINSKKYRLTNPNYILASKKLREKYKKENRCVSCGNNLNSDCDFGFITCINCRERYKKPKQLR